MFVLHSAGDGDYERLLICGMSSHLPRLNGNIQLERIGPFVPPLSLPGFEDIVATETMLRQLSMSPFKDWTTRPVIKAHICVSTWNGEQEIDSFGEPENAILFAPHDDACAASLGELYELIVPVGAAVEKFDCDDDQTEYEIFCAKRPQGELFKLQLPGGQMPMCSDAFRQWIRTFENVDRWLRFAPARIWIARGG